MCNIFIRITFLGGHKAFGKLRGEKFQENQILSAKKFLNKPARTDYDVDMVSC